MKVYDKIIHSDVEPSINNLWIHDKTIKYFDNGTWETVSGGVKESSQESSSEELESEYTIIEDNQSIDRNSITNLENNTGARTSTEYVPSGHIKKILDNCHRYLGKITLNQEVTEENINDIKSNPSEYLKLSLIQLSDKDSRYYDDGYENISTRKKASLDGIQGHGEVGVLIPGFWYKGINYLDANGVRMNYICFSTKETPSTPRVSAYTLCPSEGSGFLDYNKGSIGESFESYLVESSEATLYLVPLLNNGQEGLKVRKIRIPATTTENACVLFVDNNGIVLEAVKLPTIYYEGEEIILNVPEEAYFGLFFLKGSQKYNEMVPSTPCIPVLYASVVNSEDLNLTNIKDWIADMEPEWVYSEPVFIHAGEATGTGNDVYTSFDGTKLPAHVYSNSPIPLYRIGVSHMSYRSNKLLTILFRAKYGSRDSQAILGDGNGPDIRYIGITSPYGMTDTKAASEYGGSAVMPIGNTYEEIISPSFLGIENIFGNTAEYLSGLSMQSNSPYGLLKAEGKREETRYLPVPTSMSTSLVTHIRHGKYCDITSIYQGGSGNYCDNQLLPSLGNNTAIARGGDNGNPGSIKNLGIFCMGVIMGPYQKGGIRMTYDGDIEVLSNIHKFNNIKEIRTTDDITL